jgi:hypothetical protein
MKKHIFKAGDRVLVVKSDSDDIPEIKAMLNLEFTVTGEGYIGGEGRQGCIAVSDANNCKWYFNSDELKLISPEAEKISEILHRAADDHLRDGEYSILKATTSCAAIWYAIDSKSPSPKYNFDKRRRNPDFIRVMNFLDKVCGLSEKQRRKPQFLDLPYKDRQQVRYAWLKACAMLAEEYNQ